MFCTKCGKEIQDGMAFCPECGAKVENIAEVNQKNESSSASQGSGVRLEKKSDSEADSKSEPKSELSAFTTKITKKKPTVCKVLSIVFWVLTVACGWSVKVMWSDSDSAYYNEPNVLGIVTGIIFVIVFLVLAVLLGEGSEEFKFDKTSGIFSVKNKKIAAKDISKISVEKAKKYYTMDIVSGEKIFFKGKCPQESELNEKINFFTQNSKLAGVDLKIERLDQKQSSGGDL